MLDEDFLETFFYNLGQYAIPNNNEQLIQTIDQLSKKYELVLLSNYFEKSQRNRLESIGINKYLKSHLKKRNKHSKSSSKKCNNEIF